MQFNKCSRCGCFFVNVGEVCPNCQPKDNNDMNKLKKFLDNSDKCDSIESISFGTGITVKNLNRYFTKKDFINYKPKKTL